MSSLTKKDFELIARSLNESFKGSNDFGAEIRAHVSENMADALANTNPLFNRQRFLRACGLETSAQDRIAETFTPEQD